MSGVSPVIYFEMERVERNNPFRSRNRCTLSSGGKNPTSASEIDVALVMRMIILKSNQILHRIVKLLMFHMGPILGFIFTIWLAKFLMDDFKLF